VTAASWQERRAERRAADQARKEQHRIQRAAK